MNEADQTSSIEPRLCFGHWIHGLNPLKQEQRDNLSRDYAYSSGRQGENPSLPQGHLHHSLINQLP